VAGPGRLPCDGTREGFLTVVRERPRFEGSFGAPGLATVDLLRVRRGLRRPVIGIGPTGALAREWAREARPPRRGLGVGAERRRRHAGQVARGQAIATRGGGAAELIPPIRDKSGAEPAFHSQ
jgi:hypothetical protein